MTSFNHIRMEDGSELSLAEWLHQPVHSTIEFNNTAPVNDLRAFNYVRGGRVSSLGLPKRNATDQDTNIVKAGAMNQDEAILVFALTFEVFGLTTLTDGGPATIAPAPLLSGTDLRRLHRDAMLEFYVGAAIKKPQFDSPFAYFGQSMGATVVSSGDTGGGANIETDFGTAGRISGSNQHALNLPIYVGGFGDQARPGNSMTFYAKFYNAFGGVFAGLRQPVRIKVVADGLKKRPA
jgi:hypothetical protein